MYGFSKWNEFMTKSSLSIYALDAYFPFDSFFGFKLFGAKEFLAFLSKSFFSLNTSIASILLSILVLVIHHFLKECLVYLHNYF